MEKSKSRCGHELFELSESVKNIKITAEDHALFRSHKTSHIPELSSANISTEREMRHKHRNVVRQCNFMNQTFGPAGKIMCLYPAHFLGKKTIAASSKSAEFLQPSGRMIFILNHVFRVMRQHRLNLREKFVVLNLHKTAEIRLFLIDELGQFCEELPLHFAAAKKEAMEFFDIIPNGAVKAQEVLKIEEENTIRVH